MHRLAAAIQIIVIPIITIIIVVIIVMVIIVITVVAANALMIAVHATAWAVIRHPRRCRIGPVDTKCTALAIIIHRIAIAAV